MIKAVMFDFWGTLIDGVVNEQTLERADRKSWDYLKKRGFEMSYEDYRKRRDRSFEVYEEHKERGVNLKAEEIMRMGILYDVEGATEEDARELVHINEMYDCDIKFKEGCEDLLKELKKRKIKIAMVSNTWLTHGRSWLKKAKLDKYFDAIILSSEAGVAKPDRRIFEMAAKELDVDLKDCVFVGDKHEMDIHGAHSAGFKCAIAVEPFTRVDGLAEPIATVKSLREIPAILSRL